MGENPVVARVRPADQDNFPLQGLLGGQRYRLCRAAVLRDEIRGPVRQEEAVYLPFLPQQGRQGNPGGGLLHRLPLPDGIPEHPPQILRPGAGVHHPLHRHMGHRLPVQAAAGPQLRQQLQRVGQGVGEDKFRVLPALDGVLDKVEQGQHIG